MRESTFVQAVNKKLPADVHHQSMTGATLAMNGTPDQYYDGPSSDLWVEYKYVKPTRAGVNTKDLVTSLQCKWLVRRWTRGENVCVIVGVKGPRQAAGFILERPAQWDTVIPMAYIAKYTISGGDLATYIATRTGSIK